MALIVEDGTGKDDATSFVTRAEYIAYAAARGVVVADVDASDIDLIKAVDFLLAECWRGNVTVAAQALPFPRTLYNFDGTLAYPSDEVPTPIKRAQMMLALASKSGVDLMPNFEGGASVTREKIGPIETEYSEASLYNAPSFPAVTAAIAPYTCGQGGSFRVIRV
jgi:hypothetical protein